MMISLWMLALAAGFVMGAGLAPGDRIELTLRGVDVAEQQKVSGSYTVGDDGTVALPLLDGGRVRAGGLSPDQFARAVESAYRKAGIYTGPVVDVRAAKDQPLDGATVSVGGHVKRAGRVPFRQGMTMLEAINAAGGRDAFGSRNVMLFRGGRQYCLDFEKLHHKNVMLHASDSVNVEQNSLIDRWKGKEEQLRALFPEKAE